MLVQTNFGGLLTIAGVPLWKQLGLNPFAPQPAPPNAGSIMIVVATDAPLSDRNLERLARRALVGLSRTGCDDLERLGRLRDRFLDGAGRASHARAAAARLQRFPSCRTKR